MERRKCWKWKIGFTDKVKYQCLDNKNKNKNKNKNENENENKKWWQVDK